MLFDPQEGVHYPGSTGDFLAWFSSDVDCLGLPVVAAVAERLRLPDLGKH